MSEDAAIVSPPGHSDLLPEAGVGMGHLQIIKEHRTFGVALLVRYTNIAGK